MARRRDDDRLSHHARRPDRFSEQASVRVGNMKEHYIRTLLEVVDEADLAEEEVCRCEAEDKRCVFVLNIVDSVPREECLGMRCSTSTPTMAFRSVGSHQRTILLPSTALAFSFSFIQPSVTVERRLPNVGKASLINTPSVEVRSVAYRPAGRMKESRYAQLERNAWTKCGLQLLRNAVKPEGVDDLTSDDIRSMFFLQSRLHFNASPLRVVDILPQTQAQDSKDAHNLPTFNTTPEFTNMLALSTDHHLKVGLLPVLLFFPH
ncbi:hypothetical protein EDB85DRAFT_2153397 [Lactarius pseudohatsudake]|nr:hypothetical protein EDB85DRAFT_2153397 [Lactarius pseudohatsudake]